MWDTITIKGPEIKQRVANGLINKNNLKDTNKVLKCESDVDLAFVFAQC